MKTTIVVLFDSGGHRFSTEARSSAPCDLAAAIQRKITEKFPCRVFIDRDRGHVEYLDRKKDRFTFWMTAEEKK